MIRPLSFARMLGKRLLRRPGFWVLLALITALSFAYSASAREDAGIVTVALAREDANDALADATMQALPESSRLIRYILCHSPAEAIDKVRYGKADCAWVFHAGMAENVTKFIRTRSARDAFVTVYQREDMALLTLARERLNASLYEAIAKELYLAKLAAESEALAALTEQERLSFWENARIPGELFAYRQVGAAPEQNHLLSPVRGLLAAIVLLGALGSGMYHRRDAENGTFGCLPYRLAWLPELLSGLWACLALSISCVAALAISGISQGLGQELLCAGALALGCVSFSMALNRFVPGLNAMAALLPLILCAALVTSPVFFDVDSLAPIGCLMPLSHYLWAMTDFSRFPWQLVYSAICLGLAFVPKRK